MVKLFEARAKYTVSVGLGEDTEVYSMPGVLDAVGKWAELYEQDPTTVNISASSKQDAVRFYNYLMDNWSKFEGIISSLPKFEQKFLTQSVRGVVAGISNGEYNIDPDQPFPFTVG